MFTGIIQAIGRIAAINPRGGDQRLLVDTGALPLDGVGLGDSIAVSGVCLTAVELGGARFAADVSRETLSCTTIGALAPGDAVNLELALTPATRMGGHIVSGHVDGVGEILQRSEDARSVRFRIGNPRSLARYIAGKGSICVDGISLTVNAVGTDWFDVNIVPHTLTATTLGASTVGRRVNLEVDLLSRYLERLLTASDARQQAGTLSRDQLVRAGFAKESDGHD